MYSRVWLYVLIFCLQTAISYEECGRSTVTDTKGSRSKRIIGGETAKENSWPWLVSFVDKKDNSKQYCSGSLIDPYWILTTAHCFVAINYTFPVYYWTYIAGNHFLDKKDSHEQLLEPAEIFIHPKYVFSNNYFPGDYDIALIRLRFPANMTDQVRTICLPNDSRSDEAKEDKYLVVGWGNVYDIGGYNRSRTLKQLRVSIIPLDKCNGSLSYGGNITQRQLCAGHTGGGQDACSGDSGGPLQYLTKEGKWIIKGLVSWGRGCARKNMYGVYTDVKSLLGYIKKTIKGTACGERRIRTNHARPKRIVGGKEATMHSWPWIVNIVSKKSGLQTCAGSIVASNWILTAAHCFGNTDQIFDHKFQVGGHSLDHVEIGEQNVTADAIYVHPNYIKPDFTNPGDFDVALIKLKYSLDWNDNVAPVCLPSTSDVSSSMHTQCYVTGWGNVVDSQEYKRSKVLKESRVEEVSQERCNSNMSYAGKIPSTFFCAGFPEGGNDTCYGDSGGALQCDTGNGIWIVKGIVSWGKGCARPNYYGVYSNVSRMVPFINAIMSGPDYQLQRIMKLTIQGIEREWNERHGLCAKSVFTIMSLAHPKLTNFDLVRTLVLQPIDIFLLKISSPRDVELAFAVNATCKSMTIQHIVNKLTQVRWRYIENNDTLGNTAQHNNITREEIASLLRKTVISLLLMPNIKSDILGREIKEIQATERNVSGRLRTFVLQLLKYQPDCELDLFKLQRAVRKHPYNLVKNMDDDEVKKMISQNHVEVFIEHVQLKNLCVFLGQSWTALRELSLRQVTVGLLGISLEVLKKSYDRTLFENIYVKNTLREVGVFWNISTVELTIEKILTASKLMEDKYECSRCHENSVYHVVNCEVVCLKEKCPMGECDTNLVHGPCSCEARKRKPRNSSTSDKLALIIGVSSGCLVAFLIIVFACFISKHRLEDKSRNIRCAEKPNEEIESNQSNQQKEPCNNNVLPRSKIVNGKSGSYVAIDDFDAETLKPSADLV